jgi:hypothetical protein
MRAMRTTLLVLSLFAVACGDEGNNNLDMTIGPDLAVPLDLTPPQDMAMWPPTVGCGTQQCDQNNGQICCVTGMQGSFMSMCSTATQCTTNNGNSFACDGPEDCPTTMASCCVTVAGMLGNADAGTMTGGNGGASCTGTCPASAMIDGNGGFTAHSKLCHHKADCKNYSGSAPLVGTVPFDGCCTSPMFGDYSVCFPAQYAAQFSATCVNF